MHLLLHLQDSAGAVTIRGGEGSEHLLCMGYGMVGDCCGAPSGEGHSYSVAAGDAIIFVSPYSTYPFKQQDQVEAFLRLECTASCNQEVAPAVDTTLDGCVGFLGHLVLVEVEMKEICVVNVYDCQNIY